MSLWWVEGRVEGVGGGSEWKEWVEGVGGGSGGREWEEGVCGGSGWKEWVEGMGQRVDAGS